MWSPVVRRLSVHRANFNQPLQKKKEIQTCSNQGPHPHLKGKQNRLGEHTLMTLNSFSKTTGLILIILNTKHSRE